MEHDLKVGEKRYTLKFGNKALRTIEQELEIPITKLNTEYIGINGLTVMLWAGLRKNHPDLTLDDVDDIIDEGGQEAIFKEMMKALESAFPQAEKDGGAKNAKEAAH